MTTQLTTDRFLCVACEKFFHVTADMAATIRHLQSDTDTESLVLCDDCTLAHMIEEASEADYLCYLCGNNLEVGIDAEDDICWHCRYDQYGEDFD